MDKKILMSFYNFTRKNQEFEKFIYKAASFSSVFFLLIYFCLSLYLLHIRSSAIYLFLLVPFTNLILSYMIRKLVKRIRPYNELNLITCNKKKKGFSFPSNHASSASIIAFSCLYINKFLGVIVFILAILTGLSRLFIAAHYPTDVCAGFFLSAIVAIIGFNIIPVLFFI